MEYNELSEKAKKHALEEIKDWLSEYYKKNQNLISKKTNVSFPFLLKCFYIQFKQFV